MPFPLCCVGGGGGVGFAFCTEREQVSGLLAMKAAIIALIALAFGLSVANAQQTGLLLSQVFVDV